MTLSTRTRQLTGTPIVYRAYVIRRFAIIKHCVHNHRSDRTAEACAKRMVNVIRAKIKWMESGHGVEHLEALEAARKDLARLLMDQELPEVCPMCGREYE